LKTLVIAGVFSLFPKAAYCAAKTQIEKQPNIIVIFTDDQGFADLGCQQQLSDIKTPHIDALARDGVRCSSGYITSPQCCPSRAGLITGRYQQRFGTDHNGTEPPPLDEVMLPQRLQKAGYATGMVGKWHLEPNHSDTRWMNREMPGAIEKAKGKPVIIPESKRYPYFPSMRGFTDTFWGPTNRYWATYDLEGNDLNKSGQWRNEEGFRLDIQTKAAVTFIRRHHHEPFFLYLAYFAPHVPLEATEKYLERFPGDMPTRRRYALAMMSAFDDGVGVIRETLREYGILDNTIIFFISDNGAPLKIDMKDIPISFKGGAWDGSRNDPWVGEKGMLSEGGIRVPFIVSWPKKLPAGVEYHHPVISLDVAATAMAAAGQEVSAELDGIDLVPYLMGTKKGTPHQALYWRFWNQSAIRKGKWKYLQAGNKAYYLFDLENKEHEKNNLIDSYPDIAEELQKDLEKWASQLKTPGVPAGDLEAEELGWFEHYFKLKSD